MLTPAFLITLLTGHDEWLLSLRSNSAVYNQIWQFIFTLPSEEYTKVYDLPLLFTESGTLVALSASSDHVYYVIRNARLRHVFAQIRESLIDVSLFSEAVLLKLIEVQFMNARNIEHVTKLDTYLHVLLPPVEKNCKVISRNANSFPTNEWLRSVWQYLAAENCDLSAYQSAPLLPVEYLSIHVSAQHAAIDLFLVMAQRWFRSSTRITCFISPREIAMSCQFKCCNSCNVTCSMLICSARLCSHVSHCAVLNPIT